MPAQSKVQDLSEAVSWLREGRTYQWIVDEYVRKYGVQTTVSMWSALRRKHARDGAVVHYDRALTSGWSYVLRRDGIDLDLIREPKGLSGSQDRGSNAIAVEVLIVYGDGRAVPFDPLLLEAFGEHSR